MQNKWRVSGPKWRTSETSTEVESLEKGIYKMEMDFFGIYLNRLEDKFPIPVKVYGSDKSLVERVYKTYHATTGNLGVLLNGLKGTGKSLTSKMICNKMELPVIIVDNSFKGGAADFISEIPDDVVLFFDEYEKNFSTEDEEDGRKGKNDHSLLAVMDGAMTSKARKIFLLTTNNPRVNENMLQRPGRIRYFKTFSDLGKDIIIEIVEDKLKNPDLQKPTIDFISGLEIISMDIVNAIIDEVNIHDEDPTLFKDVFNVEEKDDYFNVYKMDEKGLPELFKSRTYVSPDYVDSDYIGNYFNVGKKRIGVITGILDDGGDNEGYKVQLTDRYGAALKGKEGQEVVFTLEKTRGYHASFADYAY